MKRYGIALLCCAVLGVLTALSQIPRTLSYQGVLTDSLGNPKPDGTYTFTFRIYQVSGGGSSLWSEQKVLQVKRGLFQTALGDQVIFGSALAFDRPYWLGVQVASDPEMSPRIPLTATGYSLNSVKADTALYSLATASGVTGSGTTNSIPKWTTGNSLGNSRISDNGTSVSIGPLGASGSLVVTGDLGAGVTQYPSQVLFQTPNSDGHLVRLAFLEGPDVKAQIESGRQATASDGYMAFRTRVNGGTVAEVMRLTKDGNVGIGNTTPNGKLEVSVPSEGTLAFRLLSGPNAFLDITPTGSTNTVFSTVNNRNIIFQPGTGNVGIGVTNPSSTLSIARGTGTPTATAAALSAETFNTLGEGAWLRTASSSNVSPVIKLNRHPSGTSNFVEGFNWDGTTAAVRKFHIDGNGTYTTGSDFAEAFDASGGKSLYQPGDVVVLSSAGSRAIEKSTQPYDTKVAGVYSSRPGVLGADKDGVTRVDENDIPVAIVGIVPTKVTDENGPIQPGDLLTTSSIPGRAMKASPVELNGIKIFPTGTIIGKALGKLASGDGVINVLVTIR